MKIGYWRRLDREYQRFCLKIPTHLSYKQGNSAAKVQKF